MYQEKIYGSDKDLLSVVFFGTESHVNDEFKHISVLHVSVIFYYKKKANINYANKKELEQPSAERIKQLEQLSTSICVNLRY